MARSADRPEGRRPLQVMEKTLSSITGAVVGLVSQYSGFTKDFQLLVKAIGEARTKHVRLHGNISKRHFVRPLETQITFISLLNHHVFIHD